jgi:prepilin-type processing-associated H-X9-DG protein
VKRIVDSKIVQDKPRDARSEGGRPGFTLVELLVMISIVGLLISLLMPAVQGCREAARRTQCANNLRQLAIAAQSYHCCWGSFPPPRMNSADPWGHIVRLLPFLDQDLAFNDLDLSKPVADPVNARVAALPLQFLLCPSDTNRLASSDSPLALPGWWRNNYRGNAGNDTGEMRSDGTENNNGVFVTGRRVSAGQISDGVGNTALFCESLLGDGNDNVVSKPGDWFIIAPASHKREDMYMALQAVVPRSGAGSQVSLAGRTFTSGNYLDSRYNHIMPPNGPSGVVPDGRDLISAINDGLQATTASSRHPGGVNLALVDGSVRFVKNSVSLQPWWALGSIRGGEGIYEEY